MADVGTPVVGVIAHIDVERGDDVRAGQPLARLAADVERANARAAQTRASLDADLRMAEAQAALARRKLDRSRELAAQEFISPQALDQAAAEHTVAAQRVAQAAGQLRLWRDERGVAEAQLGLRTVRSPIAGSVVEVYANTGERIEERPLLRIAQLDRLRVELMVPVAHFGRLQPGGTLTIRPELPGAAPVAGTITHVDKVSDAASNTFRVRLELPNADHRLPAGLRCRADLPPPDAAAVPAPIGDGGRTTAPLSLRLTQEQ